MELEETSGQFKPVIDHRVRMPEPLPVRLIAVDHVTLPAPPDIRSELDTFYVGLLQFEKVADGLTYRADNFMLKFDVHGRPVVHESLRPQQIEVLSLAETEKKLIEAELEYTRQRGLTPGDETLLLLDPAGNWIELVERRIVP